MPTVTLLDAKDSLPLTCSRTGTCCHGKNVNLNPYELAYFSRAKGITPREFRDRYCEFGGIKLAFDGPKGWKDFTACSLYDPSCGCTAHTGRPLACRLYPLGLQRQGEQRTYIYQGTEFPCLDGCPEVEQLPSLTVEQYIEGQGAELFEQAQDEYLSLMEDLADGAFALLIDSGLAETGDRETLKLWRKMGSESPKQLEKRIGSWWIDRLMLPAIDLSPNNPETFRKDHYDLLQQEAQEAFGALDSIAAFRDASVLMMGLALHLGRGLGANPNDLAEQWINTAKENGALE